MNIEKLITAAKEIEVRYKRVEERTKFMQKLAAEARRTGKSLTHRIGEAPEVTNFEDPIRDLISALHSKPFDPNKNIGKQCIKDKKPFKSGLKVNTIKGVINHPVLQIPAYTFVEDDSFVECRRCKLFQMKKQ